MICSGRELTLSFRHPEAIRELNLEAFQKKSDLAKKEQTLSEAKLC